jgi:hypothetical protein
MWQDFAASDLARSGLSLSDIQAEEAVGPFGSLDGYKIPYFTIKNERHPKMWRVRMAAGDNKYHQPDAQALGEDTAPPYFHKHCDYEKPGTHKVICEGEKKALAAFKFLQNVQTIGIGGCWNWQAPLTPAEKKRRDADPNQPIMARLHPDIVAFCKNGRGPVYYIPDADYRTNDQVLRALGSMRLAFAAARIDFRIVLLPTTGKGLDDFLMAQPAGTHDAAFWALERVDGRGMLTRPSDMQAKIGLRVNGDGRIVMVENLVVDALAKWDYLTENYYYDIRSARHMLRDSGTGKFSMMSDIHVEVLKRHMQSALGFTKLPRDFLESVMHGLATKFPRNPLSEYLRGLVWDGVSRFPQLVVELGVPERLRGYAECIMRNVVTAATARAIKPGTKFDHCVILEGAQGFGKSTFWEQLAVLDGVNYYAVASISANSHVIGTRDFLTAGSRAIFYDLDELSVLSKSDVNAVKTMLSTTVDTYRPAYGRADVEVQRSFVCVGSTNSETYLIDNTGNRRFWPVRVGDCERKRFNMRWLAENREQLWAEAMYLYRTDYTFWDMPEEYVETAKAEQEERMLEDGFEDPIREVLNAAFATDPARRPPTKMYMGVRVYCITNTYLYDALNVPLERRMALSRRVPQLVKKLTNGQWTRATIKDGQVVARGHILNCEWADAQPRVDIDSVKY